MSKKSSNIIAKSRIATGSTSQEISMRGNSSEQSDHASTSGSSSSASLNVSHFRPGRGGFGGVKLKTANVGVRYTPKPIIPAEKAELISVAKAMHRENFGKNVQNTFAPEVQAAIRAVETGHYVGWRCPEYTWDCIRVGEDSKCFCGHLLNQHRCFNGTKGQVSCAINDCRCRMFAFVPSRPEDVGEFWLRKRPGYDATKWKAKCRCKHAHTTHSPIGLRKCQTKGCRCVEFESDFLCAACDKHWEEHETFFETEEIRVANGLPIGEAYLPFAEIPDLRNMALTADASDNSSYSKVANSQSPFALTNNTNTKSLQMHSQPRPQIQGRVSNDTPVPFGYHAPKGSPFD